MKKLIGKTLAGMLGMLAACSLGACSEEGNGGGSGDERREIPATRSEAEVVARTNAFALKLTERMTDEACYADGKVPANYVVSPLSLSMALSMVANGAGGETRDEILDVLGFEASDLEAANTLNAKLREYLPTLDAKSKVHLANAMWFDEAVEGLVSPEFEAVLSASYQASSNVVNGLGSIDGMKQINSWAAEYTSNLIPELLPEPLGANTVMALTNALYFKGQWAHEFKKSDTKKARFINADATASDVYMMKASGVSAQAFEDEGYKAASLCYGNGSYSMIIVVPDFGRNPAEVLAGIGSEDLASLVGVAEYSTHLDVRMPRFDVETSTDMIAMLTALGVRSAFMSGADFSGIWTESLDFCINKVWQSAKIGVDEKGAEAASSTIVSGGITSPGPVATKDFVVDRPFAFAIAERSTGALLFTGVVTQL